MRTRRLGGSDLEVTVVGLGCNNFGSRIDEDGLPSGDRRGARRRASPLRHRRHLRQPRRQRGDHRPRARRAARPGRARDEVRQRPRRRRDAPAVRGRYIRKALEASLRRLQTDWIDLYQYHRTRRRDAARGDARRAATSSCRRARCARSARPTSRLRWSRTPHAIARRARADAVRLRAERVLLARPQRRGRAPAGVRAARDRLLPYFPLASGLLTGKYRRGEPAPEGTRWHGREVDDATFDRVERLEAFARSAGVTLLDVAIGGLRRSRRSRSVIAGATKPEQVRANAAAGAGCPRPTI